MSIIATKEAEGVIKNYFAEIFYWYCIGTIVFALIEVGFKFFAV